MEKAVAAVVEKMGNLDAAYCIRLNRWLDDDRIHRGFSTVSRLGDGVFWYSLMLLFPLLMGAQGFVITALMILMAAWGVYLYKWIKRRSMRLRPFASHACIRKGARTLDDYSFPSGHTMHAVAFTVLLTDCVPLLGWLLVPFALVTGLARVVLGLHYPSDVFMGAVLGLLNGVVMLNLFSELV